MWLSVFSLKILFCLSCSLNCSFRPIYWIRIRREEGYTVNYGQVVVVAFFLSFFIPFVSAGQKHSGTICEKAEGVSGWMEPLGRFPRVLNGLPKDHIEGPPRGFLKANPRLHLRPDPRPKTWGAAGLGSGRGCGRGLARRKSRGGAFNILLRESIGYSRDLPRGSIHHDIPKAFPQIVILSESQTNQVKQTNKQH